MKAELPYRNRTEAGRLLAEQLIQFKSKADVVVLGLTRGGVPVAAEVADALQVPLDVIVVRKGKTYLTHLNVGGIVESWKRLSHLKTRVC